MTGSEAQASEPFRQPYVLFESFWPNLLFAGAAFGALHVLMFGSGEPSGFGRLVLPLAFLASCALYASARSHEELYGAPRLTLYEESVVLHSPLRMVPPKEMRWEWIEGFSLQGRGRRARVGVNLTDEGRRHVNLDSGLLCSGRGRSRPDVVLPSPTPLSRCSHAELAARLNATLAERRSV